MLWRQSKYRISLRRFLARVMPRSVPPRSLRVLAYHRIRADADDPRSLTPSLFRAHLKILEEGYTVISLGEVVQSLQSGEPLPPNSVLITFDDGIADLHDWAAPLLTERGMGAIIFAIAGCVGKSVRTHSEANYAPTRYLDKRQLRELSQTGIEIASHGVSHVPLAALSDEDAYHEIESSKKKLEDLLGCPVRAFSFPWGRKGDFTSRHVERVREAGYEAAFTMLNGTNLFPYQPFLMRRSHVYPWDDVRLFRALLEGRFDRWSLKNVAWPRRNRNLPTECLIRDDLAEKLSR